MAATRKPDSDRGDKKDSKANIAAQPSTKAAGAVAAAGAVGASAGTAATAARMPALNLHRNPIPELDKWELPAPLDMMKGVVEGPLFKLLDGKARIELAKTQHGLAEKSPYRLFSISQNARYSLFLRNILKGNFEAVKAYLESLKSSGQSELLKHFLTTMGQAKDWREQLFEGTAYQMALAVEDTQMAELIKKYLVEITNEAEANAQFNAQFPKGWEQAEEKRWEGVFEQLEILALAVKKADIKAGDITAPKYDVAAKEGSPVKQALDEFWRRLDAVSTKVIRAGRVFNPKLLERALQIYDEHYKDYFGNNSADPRALLFVQKVIGREGIQGVMPANYVQALRDDLTTTADKLAKGILQDRDSVFDIYRGDAWVPVDFLSSRRRGVPGFNFCLYAGGVGSCRVTAVYSPSEFSKLMSIKNNWRTELMRQQPDRQPEPMKKSSCNIM